MPPHPGGAEAGSIRLTLAERRWLGFCGCSPRSHQVRPARPQGFRTTPSTARFGSVPTRQEPRDGCLRTASLRPCAGSRQASQQTRSQWFRLSLSRPANRRSIRPQRSGAPRMHAIRPASPVSEPQAELPCRLQQPGVRSAAAPVQASCACRTDPRRHGGMAPSAPGGRLTPGGPSGTVKAVPDRDPAPRAGPATAGAPAARSCCRSTPSFPLACGAAAS